MPMTVGMMMKKVKARNLVVRLLTVKRCKEDIMAFMRMRLNGSKSVLTSEDDEE